MSITFRKITILAVLALLLTVTSPSLTHAYDINDKLSVEGFLTGVY